MEQGKRVYIKLKRNIGTSIECQEFIYDNAKVMEYGDDSLILMDYTDHLIFKCKMDDVERFAVVG